MTDEQQARDEIKLLLRQADAATLPARLKLTPRLNQLVDEPTAQRLYEEVIAGLEAASGVKFKRQ
jgi:hypothetical protein